jgi:hypothetical protein
VPIQIVNLSIEEVEMPKHMYVGLAAPICHKEIDDPDDYRIHIIQTERDQRKSSEQQILEPFYKNSHLFYGTESADAGCTSKVQHAILTGDAGPIKRNPYRIPHALKPMVDEQIDDMLKRELLNQVWGTRPQDDSPSIIEDVFILPSRAATALYSPDKLRPF